MSINVLVFVELHDADIDQCNDFDSAMADRGWSKLPRSGAVYSTTVEADVPDADLLRVAQRDVNISVKVADLLLWNAVCVMSGSPPVTLSDPPDETTGEEEDS